MRHHRAMSGLTILGLVVGTLFVLAASAWTIMNTRYSRMLERELVSLRADGYALTLAEVKPKPVPDDQNAATIYMPLFQVNFDPKAGSPGNGPKTGLQRFGVDKTSLPEVLAARSTLESAAAQDALAKLKQASAMPHCVFPVRWDDGFDALFPHMAQFRQATRLVCAQAVLLAHDGRRAEALYWLVVSCRMADQVALEPTLIAQLVAVAMRAMGENAARQIITDADVPPELARPLYEQLARTDTTPTYEAAMRMELVMGLAAMEQFGRNPQDLGTYLGDGPYPQSLVRLLTSGPGRTMFKLEEANYARYMHQMLQSAAKPYRESLHAIPPVPRARFGTIMTSILVPVYSRVNQKRDQSIASTRLLQIVLALKAQKQSLGRYPESLTGLIWLPPTEDPFTGQPFTYRREGSGFLLYSVGPNLKDDGGKEPAERKNINEEGDMVWRCGR